MQPIIAENSLIHSRNPQVVKLLKALDDKGESNLNSEDQKTYIDSLCSEIMKIKEIKPDLHRQ